MMKVNDQKVHYAPMEEHNYFHNLWCRVSGMDGESGNSLKASDFSPGSIVNVILVKPVNIRKSIEKEKSFVLTAKEIVLLTRAENR